MLETCWALIALLNVASTVPTLWESLSEREPRDRVAPQARQFFEVLTTRNISLYLVVSYYISLYPTVSLISHHIRDGFCEQSRPGEGCNTALRRSRRTSHLPHPHIEAIHTACHSVQPGRGCPHTSRGSSGERRTQQGDRSFSYFFAYFFNILTY